MQEVTYIPENTSDFRVKQLYKVEFWQPFFFTKLNWSFTAFYGQQWQRLLFFVFVTLVITALTLPLDLFCFIPYFILVFLKAVFIGRGGKKGKRKDSLLVGLIKVIIERFIAPLLKMFAIVFVIYLIIFQWDDTKDLLEDITDWLSWQL